MVVRSLVFVDLGKELLLQELFFTLKVHPGELDEAFELKAEIAAIGSADEHDAQFVQRVHQDAVLIVHGFDADDALVTPCQRAHNHLHTKCESEPRGRNSQWRYGGAGMRLWVDLDVTSDVLPRCFLLQDHVGLGFVATAGQNDGRAENERPAEPGVRAEVFAEQLDAKVGTKGGFYVEENAGARGRNVMDAPVPKEGCGGGAGKAANGQGYPGGCADVGKGRRRNLFGTPGIEEHGAENPNNQHDGSHDDAVGRDHDRTMGLHELFAEENPAERGAEGQDHQQVAI